jgi:cytochrome c553
MGVGGCQECYDTTYKNESFKTSKYMAEINQYINESLNEYLNQRRFETTPLRGGVLQFKL